MKHCRDGWKEDKCLTIYRDSKDFKNCPYCGAEIVWSMPYKKFFKTDHFFGASGVLKLINELEKNHHIINVKVTEIMKWDDEPTLHSSTLIFETTELILVTGVAKGETNTDELFLAMHKYMPDEFNKVNNWTAIRPEIDSYRMWWD